LSTSSQEKRKDLILLHGDRILNHNSQTSYSWEETPYYEKDGAPVYLVIHGFCPMILDTAPVPEIAALCFKSQHDDSGVIPKSTT